MKKDIQTIEFVILDRDGVINEDSDDFIKTESEWIPIPGSLEAIARLNHVGCRVIVTTNQSGLGRGYFNIDALNSIHHKMQRELSALNAQVEAFFFCPHPPDTGCSCRKPLPGLLEDIAQRLQVDMTGMPMVGDSFRDIQAARAVAGSPSLVLTGKGQSTIDEHADDLVGVPVYKNLSAAVDGLLAKGVIEAR